MLTIMPQSHDSNVYNKANPELISILPRSDPLNDLGLHYLKPQLSAP